MVSQILFGETAVVSEEQKGWYNIVTEFDGYTGWLEKDPAGLEEKGSERQKTIILREPYNIFAFHSERLILCAGSEIPASDGKIYLDQKEYTVETDLFPRADSIITDAIKFINAPYLWGGRTIFGMDCSGFIQILFKINGVKLPRDAKDQASTGTEVKDIKDMLPGDVMFFKNEGGKIVHTGLFMGDGKIIHASKKVHVDKVDITGIYSEPVKEYTHRLSCIRRMI